MGKTPDLETMAFALADVQPDLNGQPTVPPLSWAQSGEIITVILADGRKVSATIQEINALMFPAAAAKHVGAGVPPAQEKPAAPSKKVAKK